MDEPVAAAGHAAQTGQDIPAPIEEPMEAAEPVVEPEGNHVKASEDRATPTMKNQSDPAAGSTGNSMKDDNGKKTKTSKPAKEENKNKAKKQDDKKDNEQDEKKTAAHRASSLLWHQKYVRKGVLRNPEDDAKKKCWQPERDALQVPQGLQGQVRRQKDRRGFASESYQSLDGLR